jgi:hypothetical protein
VNGENRSPKKRVIAVIELAVEGFDVRRRLTACAFSERVLRAGADRLRSAEHPNAGRLDFGTHDLKRSSVTLSRRCQYGHRHSCHVLAAAEQASGEKRLAILAPVSRRLYGE